MMFMFLLINVLVVLPTFPLLSDSALIAFFGQTDLRLPPFFLFPLFLHYVPESSSILVVRHTIRFVSIISFERYVRLDVAFHIYFSIPVLPYFSSYPSNFILQSSDLFPLLSDLFTFTTCLSSTSLIHSGVAPFSLSYDSGLLLSCFPF